MINMMMNNVLAPAVLFFVLGIMARVVKSDLQLPKVFIDVLSIYLLIAIGLKGGIALSETNLDTFWLPLIGTLFLGIIIPILTFVICRGLKFDLANAAALGATFGSVSIVTFGIATAYLENLQINFEGFMTALVVVLESPAIILSIFMLRWIESKNKLNSQINSERKNVSSVERKNRHEIREILRESIFGKSIFLMVGAMLIGGIVGKDGTQNIQLLFKDLYSGVLVLFLLGMGLAAGERLGEIKKHGLKLIGMGVLFPIFFGMLGVGMGFLTGLSYGGTIIMGVLGASASYIAAPAAINQSIPQANPSI